MDLLALPPFIDSACPAMQLLYKAFACEDFDEKKLLLPGYLADPDRERLKPGDKIKVELADGTFAQTAVQGTQPVFFGESMILAMKLRISPNFYIAIEVPHDFSVPGIELGASIYLAESATKNTSF